MSLCFGQYDLLCELVRVNCTCPSIFIARRLSLMAYDTYSAFVLYTSTQGYADVHQNSLQVQHMQL